MSKQELSLESEIRASLGIDSQNNTVTKSDYKPSPYNKTLVSYLVSRTKNSMFMTNFDYESDSISAFEAQMEAEREIRKAGLIPQLLVGIKQQTVN